MARYRITLKSRDVIDREIPSEKQGWWVNVCPGGVLRVRDATEADLARCYHRAGTSHAEYFCEDVDRGWLIPHWAVAEIEKVEGLSMPRRKKKPTGEQRPIDWGQYELNGGSYCMAVMEDDRYCGRGEKWPGHNHKAGWPNHPFAPGCPEPPTVGAPHE